MAPVMDNKESGYTMIQSELPDEAEQQEAVASTVEDVQSQQTLPPDVEHQIIFYFVYEILQQRAYKMTINPEDQLKLELRQVAVDHNVSIVAIYEELLRILSLVLSSDDLAPLIRGPLHFLVTLSPSAE